MTPLFEMDFRLGAKEGILYCFLMIHLMGLQVIERCNLHYHGLLEKLNNIVSYKS